MRECTQCGKCCIQYADGGLVATAAEIERWQQSKPEIYSYVHDGQIWMDPDTGTRLKHCPWLKQDLESKKYSCSIYLDRPEDCRHYPVTIAEMIRDGCEMIEAKDLFRPKMAQRKLDMLMADSRPSVDY